MWTKFFDLASGGFEKTQYSAIFIELPEEAAVEYFKNEFGIDPYDVACPCCGSDFFVCEIEKPEIGERNRIIYASEINCVQR